MAVCIARSPEQQVLPTSPKHRAPVWHKQLLEAQFRNYRTASRRLTH
jgi:hypothetical protein